MRRLHNAILHAGDSVSAPVLAGWSGRFCMPRRILIVLMGLLGFAIGFGLSTLSMWSELLRRIDHANAGGTGETADWGQPAFFMLVMGFLPGCGGGLLFAYVASILTRVTQSESETQSDQG